jgi:hypothetical protein
MLLNKLALYREEDNYFTFFLAPLTFFTEVRYSLILACNFIFFPAFSFSCFPGPLELTSCLPRIALGKGCIRVTKCFYHVQRLTKMFY